MSATEGSQGTATRAQLTQLVEVLANTVAANSQGQAETLAELRRLTETIGTQQANAASLNVFAAKKVKLDLPVKFDGTPSRLNAWLFAIEQYCTVVDLVDGSDRVKLAVSRLEKDALTWWRQYVVANPAALTALDWDDFRSAIEAAFDDVDKELKLRRRLVGLRQTKSVHEYTKMFRTIVLELGSKAPDDAGLVFQYIEGLKDAVKMQVLLQRPTVLSEAEQLAERADMTLYRTAPRDEYHR